jgi:hypothetical protein
MPGAVIYMLALAIWILVACTIWCAAALMCVVPRTRPFAWPTSVAVAATFPFVFAYQIMAAPVVLAALLGAFILVMLVDPASLGGTTKNPVVIVGFISAVFGSTIKCLLRPLRASSMVGERVGGSRATAQLMRCCRIRLRKDASNA